MNSQLDLFIGEVKVDTRISKPQILTFPDFFLTFPSLFPDLQKCSNIARIPGLATKLSYMVFDVYSLYTHYNI